MTTKEKVLIFGSMGVALVVAYLVYKKLSKPKEDVSEVTTEEDNSPKKETTSPKNTNVGNKQLKNKYGIDCYPKKYEAISDNAYFYVQNEKNTSSALVKSEKIKKGTILSLLYQPSQEYVYQVFEKPKDNKGRWVLKSDFKDTGFYDFNSGQRWYCDCENYKVTTRGKNLNKWIGGRDINLKYQEKVVSGIPNGTIIEIPKIFSTDEEYKKKDYYWLCDESGSVSKDYIKKV